MVLVIRVNCARNIPGEWTETSDPYVKLRYGGQVHSTKVDKDGGRNPNFNQSFTFEEIIPPGVLEIGIYDQDVGFDDFLAKGLVEMTQVMEKIPELKPQPLREFYPLQSKSGGHHGDIELEFTVVNE